MFTERFNFTGGDFGFVSSEIFESLSYSIRYVREVFFEFIAITS
jgi:hypothetical protein